MLHTFGNFYYLNGRLPYTNGHLFVLDGEKPSFISGNKISLKRLYELFRGTKLHGLVSMQFLAKLNLFLGRKEKISKNPRTEQYYNLSIQILAENKSSFETNFENLTNNVVEINLCLQNAILSNKSHKQNLKKKQETKIEKRFDFLEEQSMDEKIEEKLNKSIIENKNIPLKKRRNRVWKIFPKNSEQIEAETEERNENFLNTAMEFNEVDIAVSKEREDKKIEETIDEIVGEKKIIHNTEDFFIDESNIFENYNIEGEDKRFILDLTDRTGFSMDRNIFPEEEDKNEEIKPAIPKEEYKKYITIEDIVMKNEPLPIFKKNEEKNEGKKVIDDKIKIKDQFHKQKDKLNKNEKLNFQQRLNLRKRKLKKEDAISDYRKKNIYNESVIFIKKVPLHPIERLRKSKGKKMTTMITMMMMLIMMI